MKLSRRGFLTGVVALAAQRVLPAPAKMLSGEVGEYLGYRVLSSNFVTTAYFVKYKRANVPLTALHNRFVPLTVESAQVSVDQWSDFTTITEVT